MGAGRKAGRKGGSKARRQGGREAVRQGGREAGREAQTPSPPPPPGSALSSADLLPGESEPESIYLHLSLPRLGSPGEEGEPGAVVGLQFLCVVWLLLGSLLPNKHI